MAADRKVLREGLENLHIGGGEIFEAGKRYKADSIPAELAEYFVDYVPETKETVTEETTSSDETETVDKGSNKRR